MNALAATLADPRLKRTCLVVVWLAAAVCLAFTWGTVTNEFSQRLLYSPSLLCAYLFIAGSAATICLIAIWAATSRRHWPLRAIACSVALAAFIPIRAHEPLIFFGLVMAEVFSVLWTQRLWNWWLVRQANVDTAKSPSGRHPFSFSLRDVMLGIVVVAIITWTLADLLKVELLIRWKDTLLASLLLALLALISWRAGIGPSHLLWLGMCIVAVTVAAQITAWYLKDGLYACHLFGFMHDPTWNYVDFQLTWGGLGIFAAWVAGMTKLMNNAAAAGSAASIRRRAGWLVGFAVLYLALSWTYWTLTGVREIPPSPQLAGNIYADVVALEDRLQNASPARADMLYQDLFRLLDRPGHVPVDRAQVIGDPHYRERFMTLKRMGRLSRTLAAEADIRHRMKQHDEAARFSIANLKLARLQWQGGLTVDVHMALRALADGRHDLAKHREKLSPPVMRNVIDALQSLDDGRDPPEVIVRRTDACERLAQRWRKTLETRIYWEGFWFGDHERHPDRSHLEQETKRATSLSRLLQADLAIRLFLRDHDQFPQTLEELVPAYLPAVPIDPFSNRPLVYRSGEGSFVLYSVGPDGEDNRGKTPATGQNMFHPHTDWDLDCYASQ